MLNKETINFLKDLRKNNNREWFTENKVRYEQARSDFQQLVSELIREIAQFDKQVAYLEPKNCIFRIYRDIRFSLDKTPYKTHFGAVFRPKQLGKSSGYYLHLDPEESFITCGHYMLEPNQLKKIRKGIYEDYETLREIFNQKDFKEKIGEFYKDDDMLKRVPNGFDKDHPAAEYLKLKHYYVLKTIPAEKFAEKDFVSYAGAIYKKMYPLNLFLNELLLD